MNLRQKIIFLITVILTCLITVLSVSLSRILLKSFAQLEENNTRDHVQRVQQAIDEELNKLASTAGDWAGWDDTYYFVKQPNQTYLEKNLYDTIFENLQLNLFLLYNQQYQPISQLAYDLENSQFVKHPQGLEKYLAPGSILLKHSQTNSNIQGFLLLKEGLLMLVSKPVLTSEGKGPIAGSMIMGRWLNQPKIEDLEQRTKLSINLDDLKNLSPDLKPIIDKFNAHENQDQVLIKIIDENTIAGYSLVKDIYKKPIVLLEIKLSREIHQQAKIALFSLVTALVLVGLVFELVTIMLLNKLILYRLSNLNNEIQTIGETNNLSLRVRIGKERDELTNFANTINWMLDELDKEKKKTEKLLLNILPESIANQLKQDSQIIAQDFDQVTILFADIVGFTSWSSTLHPLEVVKFLNHIFSDFDYLAEQLGLEKIKTIGDAYMVAAGLPIPRSDHAQAIAEMALAMQAIMTEFSRNHQQHLQMRIGINTGVVVAGVIGTKKFVYDLWGDAVNIASRMESSGEAGKIQVTETTYQLLKNNYIFEQRGTIDVKGKGQMETYWLKGRRED